jgi:hypothetical protein
MAPNELRPRDVAGFFAPCDGSGLGLWFVGAAAGMNFISSSASAAMRASSAPWSR